MLLDRDRELDSMGNLLAEVGSSGGKVVLVRGEAGIGKSSLVRGFVERHADEARIHIGFCDDLLIPQPLGPFWDIARSESTLSEPLANGDRPGVLGVVMDLLSRSLRPTVVVIEDSQWADEATLDAIKFLGRRIAGTNGLLLLTYRDGAVDHDHPLRGVIGDLPPHSVVRMRLAGLSLSAVASIIGDSDLDAEEVVAVTDGNPFLVGEMASSGGGVVSASVQDSVAARVRRLAPGAQVMLKTLSVVPERISSSEFLQLTGGDESQLFECEQRGLLTVEGDTIAFRHELIRRAVGASLTRGERVANNRKVLEALPPDTDPARLVHHAREANDVDRLIELAPRAARAAAAVGSHREAVGHFRLLAPYLGRLASESKGRLLEAWAHEEGLLDNISEALELNELALVHYRQMADRSAESRVLADAAGLYEWAGQRSRAEQSARQAVDVLGDDPDGADLARALEVNAYLQQMSADVAATSELVDRTLKAAGPDVDEWIVIRSLNHRGTVANIPHYPNGQASLDEARDRAEATGLWYEVSRALINHAWAAAEFRDLPIALDYAQRAIASAVEHEQVAAESYATAILSRILDLKGHWSDAEDLARDQLDRAAITQMVALPIVGIIEARTGRDSARATLKRAWEMSGVTGEFQRLAPTAIAVAEHGWISNSPDVPLADITRMMETGSNKGFAYSLGSLAVWLWKLGVLSKAPEGVAEPYRLLIDGEPMAAADMWSTIGCPYDRAIALAHGDPAAQLEALEIFDRLGATAVAAKLRKALRIEGVSVPRGKGQKTRDHAAGLTAKQAEVLELLDEGLANTEIADRLFVSPRTVEHHVSAILAKLDSSNRAEAVEAAARLGLLATR